MCIFAHENLIQQEDNPEAERLFQLGRAHDVSVWTTAPDTIAEDLRDSEPDRRTAREYYQKASDLGHTGAMNNLAVYMQNGWGGGAQYAAPDHEAAFNLNVEMARRDDPQGYVGMGVYFLGGMAGVTDERKGTACLVEAAKRGNDTGTLKLAQLDLVLNDPNDWDVSPDPARAERGIALLEDLGLRGNGEGYASLSHLYNLKWPDLPKREYYAFAATQLGSTSGFVKLTGIYHRNGGPLSDDDYHDCLLSMRPTDYPDVLNICPRPAGPLSRDDAGLPPAPQTPLDLKAYLEDFAQRHPDK